ncbi:glycosyltransferase family protein [Microbacterium gorillae]|uniref:glycosyltransferase family protein n=1 Tax=Microbacterium gorillae TaxID=1231063 RepID=UPI00058E8DA4|nr:glycosyltransferase [Microbacterium gorillae]
MTERYLFLSHSHAFGPFRVGSHHYARTLASSGAEVVHLSTPVSLAHRLTGRVDRDSLATLPRGPYRDEDGVVHLVPRTFLPVPYGPFRADRELARHGLASDFDAVLIDQPLLWHPSLRRVAKRLVYRPTDLYPDGVKHTLQQRILDASDGVVATSTEVRAALGPLTVPALVIANGVDADRFAAPPTATEPRPPVAVYVGAFDGRFDWTQVIDWAHAHPDVRFVMAGPGGDPGADLPPNIELPGSVPYEALPTLLHGARVGLLPLSDDPLNAGRSPMKLYEYLSAGLAVLSRATPVIQSDADAGLYTYADRSDANAALERALAHPSPNTAGVRRAAAESWETKAATLRAFVRDLPDR